MVDEKPKRGGDVRESPCPICGGERFVWGVTVGEGPNQRLYTRPNGAGWGNGREMITRECYSCGNVQLFTKV